MEITKYGTVQSSLQGFTMALWGYSREMQEGTNGHQLTDWGVGMDGSGAYGIHALPFMLLPRRSSQTFKC